MLTSDQRQYVALYERQETPLLYNAPWWLDAVCPGNRWEALMIPDQEGQIKSAIPFFSTRIRGLSAIITPPASQWVQVISNSTSQENNLDWLSLLPKSSILDLSVKNISDHTADRHLFSMMTRYSYLLAYAPTSDAMTSRYNEGLRRNLKQAEGNFKVSSSEDIEGFVSLWKSTFHQKSMSPPEWIAEILPGLTKTLLQGHRGALRFVHENGKPVAAMLTGWDGKMDYYIAGGRTATEAGSSAHSLLLHHAVIAAQLRKNGMDFEGSMIPGVANFFHSFGATPVPYHQIRRYRGLGRIWGLFH